jgi:type I restriction-modification system DNA methylase subunit
MGKPVKGKITNTEKELTNKFEQLCRTRQSWQVWSDFITATACAIANSVDKASEDYAEREAEYEECINRLGGVQIPSEMFAITTMQLDENPEQDFLGSLFMKLNLGNHWKGQFFTPYSVCQCMADINVSDIEDKIYEHGYASVNDCACGAGATLIAMANALKKNNVNYQQSAIFVAQDIDRVAALMCYIQLSLLGCPGYVVVGNSLTNPTVGSVLNPIKQEGQEIWYMPMFASEIWHFRRVFDSIIRL